MNKGTIKLQKLFKEKGIWPMMELMYEDIVRLEAKMFAVNKDINGLKD